MISIDNIRILFIIFERKFKELEVVVKFKKNNNIFYSIILVDICEAGKEAFSLRQYTLYVYVYVQVRRAGEACRLRARCG